MARVNIDVLGISKLKWTGMGEFSSDGHYIYYCRQESLIKNEVAIIVNKRVQNAVLGCNLKNDRMISVCFQGKPFNITVIHIYALTSNAEEVEVEQFYEDLLDLLELTEKRCPFHYRGLECKSRKSRNTQSNRQIWPRNTEWSRANFVTEFCQENALIIANTHFQQQKRRFYTWTSPDGQYWNQTDYILRKPMMEKLYTVSKSKTGSWLVQIMNSLLPNSDLNWRK